MNIPWRSEENFEWEIISLSMCWWLNIFFSLSLDDALIKSTII